MKNINIFWCTDFLGISYLRKQNEWMVIPVFTSRSNAEKLWDEQIQSIDEKTLKMRFIEQSSNYKFILYSLPLSKEKLNIGFYRSISSFKTYNFFKANFSGDVYFTLGILGDGAHPEYLTESKLVTDVKFLKDTEVEKNSVEWLAEETQRQARNIDNKAVNGKQYSS